MPYFDQANEFIRQALIENKTNKVLVHCGAGMSRSGAVCCAYMIEDGNMTFDAAYALGQSNRRSFYPNENFKKQLRAFEVAKNGDDQNVEQKKSD